MNFKAHIINYRFIGIKRKLFLLLCLYMRQTYVFDEK